MTILYARPSRVRAGPSLDPNIRRLLNGCDHCDPYKYGR